MDTPIKAGQEQVEELWNADPNCRHEIEYPMGGGIVCKKCGGWFCY